MDTIGILDGVGFFFFFGFKVQAILEINELEKLNIFYDKPKEIFCVHFN